MSTWVKIRVTPEEREQWQAKAEAAGMSLSDLIRESLANPPKRRRKQRIVTADPALLRQLAAIGNNLNQLARAANMIGLAPADNARLLSQMVAVERELAALRKVSEAEADAP